MPNGWYAITKTFDVIGSGWETDTITETLTVWEADPPTIQVILEFVEGQRYIYLPIVMRSYP